MIRDIAEIKDLIRWYQTGLPRPQDSHFCATRDVFQARVEMYFKELLRNLSDPQKTALLISAIGEIGNNSFDHNLGKWQNESGMVFYKGSGHCVLIDRGQGIKASLQSAGIELKNEDDYINTAFTQVLSGRAPERRGNGLKLVASIVKRLGLSLYLRSGNGNIFFGKSLFDSLDKALKQKPNAGVFAYISWSDL